MIGFYVRLKKIHEKFEILRFTILIEKKKTMTKTRIVILYHQYFDALTPKQIGDRLMNQG